MDRRYIVLAVFFAAFIAWGGMVLAQTAKPAALKTNKPSVARNF